MEVMVRLEITSCKYNFLTFSDENKNHLEGMQPF